jgi:hypothetical protein
MGSCIVFVASSQQGRGRLLDTGEVTLAAPGSHTLHCLVDLDVCNIGPWFILQDPTPTSGGLHTVQYQLNDHTGMLTLARQAGRSGGGCRTCLGGANGLVVGLRVEVQGVVTTLGDGSNNNPPRIDVTSMKVSNGLPVSCANVSGTYPASEKHMSLLWPSSLTHGSLFDHQPGTVCSGSSNLFYG